MRAPRYQRRVPLAPLTSDAPQRRSPVLIILLPRRDLALHVALRASVERFQAGLADSVVARDAALQDSLASDD